MTTKSTETADLDADPRYVNTAVASTLAKVPKTTIKSWISSGHLPSTRVPDVSRHGFHFLVLRTDVMKAAASRPAHGGRRGKKVSVKMAVKRTSKKRRGVTVAEPQQDQEGINSLNNHISFAYGWVSAWLQNYANLISVPFQEISGPVGNLLVKGAK